MMLLTKLSIAVILVTLLCFASSLPDSVHAQTRQANAKSPPKQVQYACPMHPDVTSTKPGRCPKCGMDLRPVKAPGEAVPAATAATPIDSSPFSSLKIPNALVVDQNGKQLNFYSDLIKGNTVAINFIFTTCTASCPPLTATFRRVQQDARERGLEVHLISVSVDPTVDTPERLHDFAAKFKAEPGWTFVTGNKGEIDSVLEALGVAVANKNDHTPMILIGNDVADYWTRAYGLASPATLVKVIAEAADRN